MRSSCYILWSSNCYKPVRRFLQFLPGTGQPRRVWDQLMVQCLRWTQLDCHGHCSFGYAIQGTLWGNNTNTIKPSTPEAYNGIWSCRRNDFHSDTNSYVAICHNNLLCPIHLLFVTRYHHFNYCEAWGVLAVCHSKMEELLILICCFSCLWCLDPNVDFLHEKKPIHSTDWAHSLRKRKYWEWNIPPFSSFLTIK